MFNSTDEVEGRRHDPDVRFLAAPLRRGIRRHRQDAGVKTFLFEVKPNDLGIFAAALGVLACAGLLASALPARRAATVDPLIALRGQ